MDTRHRTERVMGSSSIRFEPVSTHWRFKNIKTGKRIGRLTVLGFAGFLPYSTGKRCPFWWCQCKCGKIKKIYASSLHSHATRSCTCLKGQRKKIRRRVKRKCEHCGNYGYFRRRGLCRKCYRDPEIFQLYVENRYARQDLVSRHEAMRNTAILHENLN